MAPGLIPFLLVVAASNADNAQTLGVRATVLARVEILVPVTNDSRASATDPVKVIRETSDGRRFVEFQ